MIAMKLATQYAPAKRASTGELQRQAQYFSDASLLHSVLGVVPDAVVALNQERQIVFANQGVLAYRSLKDEKAAYGLSVGEALNCIHAFETEGGCGTTEFCRSCGGLKAILRSQQGQADVQECRITQRQHGEALDLRVWASPLKIGDEPFTICAIQDVSHEKRRRALERIFFHDIINTAGGLQAFVERLRGANQDERAELGERVYSITQRLIEEIYVQRQIMTAENNELSIHPTQVSSIELLQETVTMFSDPESAHGNFCQIDTHAQDIEFVSDRALLRRVIGNMVKNALEACQPGEKVMLGCEMEEEQVEFWIHNPSFIPRDIQLQIFQRSFSTKGTDRGLGTYSMKLLSERYLKGRVTFTTSREYGTFFRACYPLKLSGK